MANSSDKPIPTALVLWLVKLLSGSSTKQALIPVFLAKYVHHYIPRLSKFGSLTLDRYGKSPIGRIEAS